MAHPSTMFKRSVITDYNIQYDSDLLHMEDWGFWTEIIKHGKVSNLKEPYLKYRMEGQNISTKHDDSLKERTFIYFEKCLKEAYGNISVEIKELHWRVARLDFNDDHVLANDLLEKTKMNLIQIGFREHKVKEYIDRKIVKFAYILADRSLKKALSFYKMNRFLGHSYLTYALKVALKRKKG